MAVDGVIASFVLGYHGCDEENAERILNGEPFNHSSNEYDWLGGGIYFWQENPLRALSFAQNHPAHKIANPTVVGAIIELGFCLDLLSERGIEQFVSAHAVLTNLLEAVGKSLPENDLAKKKHHGDRQVIDFLHALRESETSELPEFDTVRGVFIEGQPAYATSAIHLQSHVQICVRKPKVIKGVFRVSGIEAFKVDRTG